MASMQSRVVQQWCAVLLIACGIVVAYCGLQMDLGSGMIGTVRWIGAGIGLPGVVWWTVVWLNRWHLNDRPPAGHCRQCGYDLTANVSGVCPECGTPISRRPGRR